MGIQLTGDNEPRGLYRDFYGSPLELMPILIERGLEPISVAGVIDRREAAPEDVIDEWRKLTFFTGDAVAYDERGNAKFVLDSALLREINPDTILSRRMEEVNIRFYKPTNPTYGAMVLSNNQWEELHGDDVLEISADRLNQVQKDVHCPGEGIIKKNGVWQPKNNVIGDIWNHLSRGKDLKEYAEMICEAGYKRGAELYSADIWDRMGVPEVESVMSLMVDKSKKSTPILCSVQISNLVESLSALSCNIGLHNNGSHLVGVAQNTASVSRYELEAVLDEFKMKDPAELRKALQLYNTKLKTKKV